MSAVTFADHLGGGDIKQGCGLIGFARVGFWYYSRHDLSECKPGMWLVKLHGGSEMGEFWDMCQTAHAVVDDYGSLRRVA